MCGIQAVGYYEKTWGDNEDKEEGGGQDHVPGLPTFQKSHEELEPGNQTFMSGCQGGWEECQTTSSIHQGKSQVQIELGSKLYTSADKTKEDMVS